jgi:hypothetical protein
MVQQQSAGDAVEDAVLEREIIGPPLEQRHPRAACKPTPGLRQHGRVAV